MHRLNGKEFIVNCELIKYLEATPDTILTLVDNEKFMVRESIDEIVNATRAYKRAIHAFSDAVESTNPLTSEQAWKSPQS